MLQYFHSFIFKETFFFFKEKIIRFSLIYDNYLSLRYLIDIQCVQKQFLLLQKKVSKNTKLSVNSSTSFLRSFTHHFPGHYLKQKGRLQASEIFKKGWDEDQTNFEVHPAEEKERLAGCQWCWLRMYNMGWSRPSTTWDRAWRKLRKERNYTEKWGVEEKRSRGSTRGHDSTWRSIQTQFS